MKMEHQTRSEILKLSFADNTLTAETDSTRVDSEAGFIKGQFNDYGLRIIYGLTYYIKETSTVEVRPVFEIGRRRSSGFQGR